MKSLRRIIRKILIENQQHYEKLVTLMIDDTIENIQQGTELASAMGYIQELDYNIEKLPGIRSTWHKWKFKVGKPLYDMLCDAYENFDGNTSRFSIKPDYRQRPDVNGFYKFEIEYQDYGAAQYKSNPKDRGMYDKIKDRAEDFAGRRGTMKP